MAADHHQLLAHAAHAFDTLDTLDTLDILDAPAMPPETAFRLDTDLYFEPGACELVRLGRRIALTAREARLLGTLLRCPRTFLSAAELARRITPPGAYPIEPHSIEQTISGLRRKFGATARTSAVLRTRRCVGYGLFPQSHQPASASETHSRQAP